MSTLSINSSTCILPSELTPKQLKSLSFVPGVLNNFNEKENLPPTARAQWAYVQVNPVEFLNRFSNELGLLGVNVAICFVNKDNYEDSAKELKTQITVNLIVQPEMIEGVKAHFEEKNLSHQVLDDKKGFALPYLGSIQKSLDTMALEKLVSFIFVKNSISRQAYSTWISVPKIYLEIKPAEKAALPTVKKEEGTSSDESEEPAAQTKPFLPSNSRKTENQAENFNYVIYDETGETAPPIAKKPNEPNPKSVVVADGPTPVKKSALSNLVARFSSNSHEPPCPTAIYDSALFLSLGLFNFYCSILLLNFIGHAVEAIASVMVEAVTASALASLLFAIFVIRPSFRLKKSRLWALLSYVIFTGVAAYQIFDSFGFPESGSYLVPGAIACVCMMAALVSAFMRIDRSIARKTKKGGEELAETGEEAGKDPEKEAANNASASATIDLPAPVKKKSKKEKAKKIELKPAKKTPKEENAEPEVVAIPQADKKPPAMISTQKAIPAKPITEAQKQAIRNRLSRKGIPSTSRAKKEITSAENKAETEEQQKPLSTAEIKARLAERLRQSRATKSGLNGHSNKAASEEPKVAVAQENGKRQSIKLQKAKGSTKERANKLSLPNS